jgi:hypothetical protein
VIIVKIQGGLGNQMFQYAAARRLSVIQNTKVWLDLSWFSLTDNQSSTRFFELENFMLEKNIIKHPEELYKLPYNSNKTRPLMLLNRALFSKNTYALYKEQKYNLNKPVLLAPDNSYLEGNWTTEKYFLDVRPKILSDFCWRNRPSKKNEELILKIESIPDSVSLHIRRGDFLNKVTLEHHGVLDLKYYYHAEREIKKIVKKPHFFVFSDDTAWAKQNLKLKSQTSFIDHNNSGVEDLRIMKECKHAVIANSTFSWWAAWLNTNNEKLIFAPKKWLADPGMNTVDVIPKSWFKI